VDDLAEAVVEAVVVVEEGMVAVATRALMLHPWVAVVAGKGLTLSRSQRPRGQIRLARRSVGNTLLFPM